MPLQEIELTEALCGFQKTIEMLDKRQLLITSHPGEIIRPGKFVLLCLEKIKSLTKLQECANLHVHVLLLSADEMKCVRDEGMPRYKNPYEKGQLIITFSVRVRPCTL